MVGVVGGWVTFVFFKVRGGGGAKSSLAMSLSFHIPTRTIKYDPTPFKVQVKQVKVLSLLNYLSLNIIPKSHCCLCVAHQLWIHTHLIANGWGQSIPHIKLNYFYACPGTVPHPISCHMYATCVQPIVKWPHCQSSLNAIALHYQETWNLRFPMLC